MQFVAHIKYMPHEADNLVTVSTIFIYRHFFSCVECSYLQYDRPLISFIRSFICNTKRPSVKQSMKRKRAQIWQTNLLWLLDPPVNWAWISGRPLHCIICMTDWPCPLLQLTTDTWQTATLMDPPVSWAWISGRPLHRIIFMTDWATCLLQLTINPWQTTTLHKFHDRLTPPHPLQLTIDAWQTTTPHKFHI